MIGACLLVAVGACSPCLSADPYEVTSAPRDWTAHPAIVDLPTPSTIYAVSDVHGGYDRLVALLAASGITTGVPSTPSSIGWAAGDATLVIAGDLLDKGPKGIEVLDAAMALQAAASAAGGHVVVTLGNHEGEFLADPLNCKADASDGVDTEMRTDSIAPTAIANGTDPRGAWLRDLPFGVRVGHWFFAHAGNAGQRTLPDLEAAIEADVIANDYRGNEVLDPDSLLESRDWFVDASAVARTTAALGVDHVVFGHSPHALGADGTIAVGHDGAVFRIDCGMSPDVDYGHGEVLQIQNEVASAVSSTGAVRQLWP